MAVAARFAWAFPVAFLCLMLPPRVGVAYELGIGNAGAAMVVALFVLPLLYTVPWGRAIWARHVWWLLSVQAVLTCLPFVLFGQKWALGLSGLLGGLLLLTLPARVSWPLFAAVVAGEAVLRIGVFGVYPTGGLQFYSFVFVVPLDMGLPLYGLVRLSDLVVNLGTARTELMDLAVAQERLRAGVRLRAAIGDRLESVTTRAASARDEVSAAAGQARARLAEAARVVRQAAEQVRQVVAEERRDIGRSPPRFRGRTVAPRLALLVLVADLVALGGHHVAIVVDAAVTAGARSVGVIAVVAIVLLQLYHSLGGRADARPRAWQWTLTLQMLLLVVLVAATLGDARVSAIGMAAFPAGSALLLLAGWWAWLTFTVVAASVGVHWLLLYPADLAGSVYITAVAAPTGLAVYGLSRLTDLAEEVETTRRNLADAAADRERLRVAQDSHDLLGLGLAAVALKCDLAGRLIGLDDARARSEIDALIELAARTGSDVRKVTSGGPDLSLLRELAAARELLASTGVDVEIQAVDEDVRVLPRQTGAVAATVLREAVTNVLRHARATRCEIRLSTDAEGMRLTVTNDGVENTSNVRTRRPDGGQGLRNLTARVAAMGGRLVARPTGSRFELTVLVPAAIGAEPPAPVGDADSVHPLPRT
ncbi:histidine kinase [Actinoplanes sp. NPDC051411]|uniref:sensor histidine kinase n=1 Tax=Actinoplanes sp. NPDC051411 TaxID=3155522 RepID=UPI0034210298